MTKEQAKEQIISTLLSEGVVKVGNNLLLRRRLPTHMSGEDLIIYEVYTATHELHEFCQEDILEAVELFLDINKTSYRQKRVITVDADVLRQKNFEAAEEEYQQWCEKNNDLLATIEDKILIANDAGSRTMMIDVPREDTRKISRFFRERHFEVVCQDYAPENIEKEDKALLKLMWPGKPKTHKVSPKAKVPGEGHVLTVEDLAARGGIEDLFKHLFR